MRGELRRVIDRFLAGVLLDDAGATSNAFALLLMRMFALGVPALPAEGMQALPRQLASAADGSGVNGSESDRRGQGRRWLAGDGRGRRGAASPAGGHRRRCAIDGTTDRRRTDRDARRGHGLVGVRSPPTGPPMLWVDGRDGRRGPVVNTAVISAAAPSYAPPGRHLIQASALLGLGHPEPAESQMREHAAAILGIDAADWQPLNVMSSGRASGAVAAACRSPVHPRPSGVWTCGDHRDTASIQGALVSGRRTGAAVLRSLRSER